MSFRCGCLVGTAIPQVAVFTLIGQDTIRPESRVTACAVQSLLTFDTFQAHLCLRLHFLPPPRRASFGCMLPASLPLQTCATVARLPSGPLIMGIIGGNASPKSKWLAHVPCTPAAVWQRRAAVCAARRCAQRTARENASGQRPAKTDTAQPRARSAPAPSPFHGRPRCRLVRDLFCCTRFRRCCFVWENEGRQQKGCETPKGGEGSQARETRGEFHTRLNAVACRCRGWFHRCRHPACASSPAPTRVCFRQQSRRCALYEWNCPWARSLSCSRTGEGACSMCRLPAVERALTLISLHRPCRRVLATRLSCSPSHPREIVSGRSARGRRTMRRCVRSTVCRFGTTHSVPRCL